MIAASPSFEPSVHDDWNAAEFFRFGAHRRAPGDRGCGAGRTRRRLAGAGAAEWVLRSLAEIAMAETRAAIADQRAGPSRGARCDDALTGVGNQRAWWTVSARRTRHRAVEGVRRGRAVVLDDLKVVNDEAWSPHGDLLLRTHGPDAAQKRCARAMSSLASAAVTSFAVLAVDFEGEPTVLAERIAASLPHPRSTPRWGWRRRLKA